MATPFSLCSTCGVEHAHPLPDVCAICADERQYLPADGIQRWTTLAELRVNRSIQIDALEPGLFGLTVTPSVGIGHRPLLVCTDDGNLLWDPPGYIDTDAAKRIAELGDVRWIAASHPHMYGVQLEWAAMFGARVLVSARDADWLARGGHAIEMWDQSLPLTRDLVLYRLGGHFPGSAVAWWRGADGKGVLLSSDTFSPNPDGATVAFLRSYPNRLPLSAATVARIGTAVSRLSFDRLYGNFASFPILGNARDAVLRSAQRHIAWVSGANDELT